MSCSKPKGRECAEVEIKDDILKLAARRCRATRSPPRSASCRRSRSPRPANWRAAKDETDGLDQSQTGPRSVLVTGASRGLGLGIAQKLAAVGLSRHCVGAEEEQACDCAIAEAERGSAARSISCPFDLGKIGAIPDLVRNLRKEFGPLSGLVNNAALGIDRRAGDDAQLQIEELVRLNTLSPIVLTKYVVRSMMSDGAGRIVNIASISASPAIAAFRPMPRPRRR